MVGQMGRMTYKGNEAKSKMKISYAQTESPTRYQLEHKCDKDNNYIFVVLLINTLTQYNYIIINSSKSIQ